MTARHTGRSGLQTGIPRIAPAMSGRVAQAHSIRTVRDMGQMPDRHPTETCPVSAEPSAGKRGIGHAKRGSALGDHDPEPPAWPGQNPVNMADSREPRGIPTRRVGDACHHRQLRARRPQPQLGSGLRCPAVRRSSRASSAPAADTGSSIPSFSPRLRPRGALLVVGDANGLTDSLSSSTRTQLVAPSARWPSAGHLCGRHAKINSVRSTAASRRFLGW